MSKDSGMGAVIVPRSVVVIRGMSKPPLGFMVAASMSSIALELGAAPVALMPTFWAEHTPAPPVSEEKNPPPTPPRRGARKNIAQSAIPSEIILLSLMDNLSQRDK